MRGPTFESSSLLGPGAAVPQSRPSRVMAHTPATPALLDRRAAEDGPGVPRAMTSSGCALEPAAPEEKTAYDRASARVSRWAEKRPVGGHGWTTGPFLSHRRDGVAAQGGLALCGAHSTLGSEQQERANPLPLALWVAGADPSIKEDGVQFLCSPDSVPEQTHCEAARHTNCHCNRRTPGKPASDRQSVVG